MTVARLIRLSVRLIIVFRLIWDTIRLATLTCVTIVLIMFGMMWLRIVVAGGLSMVFVMALIAFIIELVRLCVIVMVLISVLNRFLEGVLAVGMMRTTLSVGAGGMGSMVLLLIYTCHSIVYAY